jgi:peptide/nickel transport system permease protein
VKRAGVALVFVWLAAAAAAPILAPHAPSEQFDGLPYAPPTRIRIVDAEGRWRAPFVYPWRIAGDRVERRYEEDRAHPVRLAWLVGGRVVQSADARAPLLLLGSDAVGRDVFARLLYGARVSLGVALVASAGALVLGALAGALAGYAGGWIDEALMRSADFLILLPAIYVVLALRAAMPLVLDTWQVFWLLAILLAAIGWPYVARPVRAVVATESRREYVEAARALGAAPARLIVRHLVPASRGALLTQATLLVPAFVLAEATLSLVGLGFAEPTPSWGAMLLDAARNVRTMAEFPWLLSPAAAIILFVLGLHLAAGPAHEVSALVESPSMNVSR